MMPMSEIKAGNIYLTSKDGETMEFPGVITDISFDADASDSEVAHKLEPWNFESSFEVQLTEESSRHIKQIIFRMTSNNYQRTHGGHLWRKRAHEHSRINQIRNQDFVTRTRVTVAEWLIAYVKTGHTIIDLWTHKDVPKSLILLFNGEDAYLSVGTGWKHDYRKWKRDHADYYRKETA